MRRFWNFDVSEWSGEKSCAFLCCAKMVFWLHTTRTENPDTPWTHPRASDFHDYHSDTPRHPPDIPQTSPGNTTCQQSPTDTARHPKTLTGAVWVCLAVSIGVCCCLFACRVPWRCLWDVCGMSAGCLGGVWGYLRDIHRKQRYLDVFGGIWVAVWSQNTILAQPLKAQLFFTWPYWDIKIPKPPHINFLKMIGLGHFF